MIRIAMIGLLVWSAAGVAWAEPPNSPKSQLLAQASLDAARDCLKNAQTMFRTQEFFWWSQYVLFSELELAGSSQVRLEAYQQHLARCRDFEAKIHKMQHQGQLSIQDVLDSRYYRLRAEYWLTQEKNAQAQGKTADPGTAPMPFAPPRRLAGERAK